MPKKRGKKNKRRTPEGARLVVPARIGRKLLSRYLQDAAVVTFAGKARSKISVRGSVDTPPFGAR
jgi:hypothetical protein